MPAKPCSSLAVRIRRAYAFRRAIDLAPNSPPVLMQAANFYWRTARPQSALRLTSHILHLIREYDSIIFLSYSRSGLPTARLLRDGIPQDPLAARSYFEYALSSGSFEETAAAWAFLRASRYDTAPLAGRYLDFLLAHHLYPAAAAFWLDWAAPVASLNLLFNPGFESPFLGPRFDWTPSRVPHVSEDRDSDARFGVWSLRLTFDGTENILYHGISQTVLVTPGPYHFRAWLKLHNLTTDCGLAFRIFDPASPSSLDVRTAPRRGTLDWSPSEIAFTVRRDQPPPDRARPRNFLEVRQQNSRHSLDRRLGADPGPLSSGWRPKQLPNPDLEVVGKNRSSPVKNR